MILGTVYRLQGAEFVSEFCRLLTDNKNLMDNQANPVVNPGILVLGIGVISSFHPVPHYR